jgi:hypothetical protein
MPELSPIAPCATRHLPGRRQTEAGGVRRARCLHCGLLLMRTAISRRWIIADRLG